MKKILSISLGFLVIATLSGCGHKPVIVHEKYETTEPAEKQKPKAIRTSGPLAEKEVGWTEEDYA